MQERNNNYQTMFPELRAAVKCSIDENFKRPENYSREGKWMSHGIAIILSANRGLLPDSISIAPNLSLQTDSAGLRRRGQNPNECQALLYEVWFTHSSLIINAIERRLG